MCRRVLDKATNFLSNSAAAEASSSEEHVQAKAESIVQCVQTLTVLLKDVGEKEQFVEIGNNCCDGVCVPFLRWLSAEHGAMPRPILATTLKAVAACLNSLLERDSTLREKIVSWFLQIAKDELCCQRSLVSEEKSSTSVVMATEPRMTQSVLLPVLQLTLENYKIRNDEIFTELFDSLLDFIAVCDSGSHFFLVSRSILPLFITSGSGVSRLRKVWQLIKSVHANKTTVELNNMEVVLTLLCCFHDVFIVYDSSSPFSPSFPKELRESTDGHALFDLRGEQDFWAIVQVGLTSPDPLSRKRSMYLLHCVLVSVQKAGGESVSSASHVFWWEKESAQRLQTVWNDLVLVLETLEEKQVCDMMEVVDVTRW